ncbi:MAG: amidohydrolase [Coriobacteriaceae bacterium]|nr:amidohydrolase [Coriobacteriaceae bacterium]
MLFTARYVLPVTSPHISDGAVLVRDDRIVEIGSREDLVARHPDEPVTDFGLAALLPGFVDLHTHLEYTAFRGLVNDLPYTRWKLQVVEREQVLDDRDWQDSAMLGALETLRSGITTIADITSSGASARAAVAAGLRGVIYREVSTMRKAEVPDVMSRAAEDMAAWLAAADPSLIRVGLAPHAPYSCHPELYRAVAVEAAAHSVPVSTHLAGSRDEYDFVKYGSTSFAVDFEDPTRWADVGWLPTGVSPVRYLLQWGFFDAPGIVAVHCVQVDEEDIDVLAGRGVAVAYCARCNAKLGMGVAPLKSFMSRGMTVGIGTDSPASNATMDFFDEMRFGMMLQRALSGEAGFLSAEHFVRMATIGGAKALGMDAEIGSLEPGKQADLVAVALSHSHQIPTQDPYSALVFTANQENVLMTMVAGRVMFEGGEWATLDPAEIKDRVEPIRVKLRG